MTTSIDSLPSDAAAREAATDRVDPAEVCTLSRSEITERLDWIRREILPHALHREATNQGVAFELRDAEGLGASLAELIELERECCAGIDFAEVPSAVLGQRRLELRGADPGAAVFASVPLREEHPGLGRRIATALGFGTAGGLLVCCILPLGVGALLGATAAAPLAGLDQPAIIGGVSLLSALGVFGWQRRRPRPAPAPDARSSCGPGCG